MRSRLFPILWWEGVIKDHIETQGDQSQTQKYLVALHTWMECNRMHSTIERKIVTDDFTPRDYVIILKTARIRPSSDHVKVLKHDEFLKMNGSYFLIIRPGKKLEIWLCITCGLFSLAVNARSISSCPSRRTLCGKHCHKRFQMSNMDKNVSMWSANQGEKVAGPPVMKHLMPVECHHFFDNLPH